MSGDDFYVGYLERAPGGLAAWVRQRLLVLVTGLAVIAGALAAAMSPFATSTFEFGTERTFEGVLVEHPVPTLLVDRPAAGDAARVAPRSRWLLVAFGKHGAAEAVAGLDGRRARVTGTLVHHDGTTMLELATDGVEPLEGSSRTTPGEETDLGEHVLAGEIVDSKCFLGVMKPGHLKPHRACATRCISGGIPPVLLVRDAEGMATHYVLVGVDGGALNDALLDRIAEPVEVTGRVVRRGDLLFLHAPAEAVRRLD